MISLEMKNSNTILKEKQQKYQQYNLEKSRIMNILEVKKILLSNQGEIMEQFKVTDSPLGKVFENKRKQQKNKKKKQTDANKNQI